MILHPIPMPNSLQRPGPRRMSFVTPIDPDFCSSHEAANRMQLNNWLQAHGGTCRLTWNNYIAGGPRHRPDWRSECLSTVTLIRCGDRRIDYHAIVDGSLLGQGHGSSKRDAQELAAELLWRGFFPATEQQHPVNLIRIWADNYLPPRYSS